MVRRYGFSYVAVAAACFLWLCASKAFADDYFPLEIGNYWTYILVTDPEFVPPAGANEVTGGTTTFEIVDTIFGTDPYRYLVVTRSSFNFSTPTGDTSTHDSVINLWISDGVTVHEVDSATPPAYDHFLAFHDPEIGLKVGKSSWGDSAVIEVGESVTVPAGSFDDNLSLDAPNEQAWFVDGMGMVRFGIRESASGSVWWELVEWKVGTSVAIQINSRYDMQPILNRSVPFYEVVYLINGRVADPASYRQYQPSSWFVVPRSRGNHSRVLHTSP